MSIGIIGSGNVGRALGQLFSHVGEQVICRIDMGWHHWLR